MLNKDLSLENDGGQARAKNRLSYDIDQIVEISGIHSHQSICLIYHLRYAIVAVLKNYGVQPLIKGGECMIGL